MYISIGGSFYTKNICYKFPIIPILVDNVEEEDEVNVIVLRLVNDDTKDNLGLFYEELKVLGIEENQVKLVESVENTLLGPV